MRFRSVGAVGLATLLLSACGSSQTAGTQTDRTQTTTARPPVASSPARAVVATNALALDLLRRLGSAGENVVFSPYSIQAAIAMADSGAAGETAAQINRVLSTSDASALGASNSALAARLGAATASPPSAPAADRAKLEIANGLWLAAKLSVKPSFERALLEGFGAVPQRTDFQSQPEGSRKAINDWIASHTAHEIRDLMPAGSISAQTMLVLANAIYLKAHWSSPFNVNATRPATFVTGSGARVSAPFMTQPPTDFAYASGRGYEAIELPYLYSTLAMLIVMPRAGTLERFQAALSPSSLASLQRALAPRRIELHMPRFHLRAQTALDETLAALGMPIAFTDQADFSGIAGQPPLKISTVQHGADLRVDENGTVAAAATGVAISPTAAAPSPVAKVTLDHPFVLFLTEQTTGAILFAGRVADPTKT